MYELFELTQGDFSPQEKLSVWVGGQATMVRRDFT